MYLTFLPTSQLQTSPSDVGDMEHESVTRQRRLLPGDALCGSFSSRWREPRESKYLFMQGCSMLSLARRGSDWNDLLVSPPLLPSASRWNLMSFCATLRASSVRCFISGRFLHPRVWNISIKGVLAALGLDPFARRRPYFTPPMSES